MHVLVQTLHHATFGLLLVGMPEWIGLLLFGIGLVTMAVLIRWLLGRNDEAETDENIGEKV
jgi:hypothetical protein